MDERVIGELPGVTVAMIAIREFPLKEGSRIRVSLLYREYIRDCAGNYL